MGIGGAQPSLADREAFESLSGKAPMCASHPHAFAWYCLTARFSDVVRQSWTAAAAPAAKKEGKKDAGNKKGGDKPAKKEEKKAVVEEADAIEAANELKYKAAAAKAEAAKKASGKVVIAKSILVWDVKPFGSETDLSVLAKKILEIKMDGLSWKTEWKKEPVAYGVFKIQIGAIIEDAKVSADDVSDVIEAICDEASVDPEDNEEGYMVQSTEIVVFNKL